MSRIVAGLHVDDMPEIALDVNTQTESPLDPAYGIRGKTPSFTIGTVSTLSPGESATATITGTDEDPILNLGIPQGMQGESGRDGQDGRDGNDGQTGATGATPNLTIGTVSTLSEGASATATITGTAENPILNLGIPVGATGASGQDGQDGQTGQTGATPNLTIGEVTTVAAGGSATASITGTAEEPVLNLGIPVGATGQTGQTGQTGATGATPQISIGTVSTLEPGSDATVTMSGTAEAPVLSFGLPAGQDGTIGYTPDISIGEVTTVAAGGSATASITGTAEAPILNLGIPQGAAGQNGTTPVKGTDYWTTADKGEIINAAVAATLAAYPAAESELF